MAVVWFLVSAVLVDLIGYWLHRWIHRRSSGPMHRAHMVHHGNYPPFDLTGESYRSARGNSLTVWFLPFGIVYAALWLVLGLPHPVAVLLGGLASATVSSVFHDQTHLSGSAVWRLGFLRRMAFWHHVHHRKMGRNFGIVTTAWDRIFRTYSRGSASPPAPRPPSR